MCAGRLLALGARDAARDAEGAWITTFHGFCRRILRAHAVAAGLDPGFTVLEPADGRAAQREAFDAALAGFLAEPRAAALDLAAAYTVDRLQRMVVTAHDALRSRGQTRPELPAAAARRPRRGNHGAADSVRDLRRRAGELPEQRRARRRRARCAAGLHRRARRRRRGRRRGREGRAGGRAPEDTGRRRLPRRAATPTGTRSPIAAPCRRSRSSTSCSAATPTPTRRPSASARPSTSTTSSCSSATSSPASPASPPATASASSASWSTSSRTPTRCSCSSSS